MEEIFNSVNLSVNSVNSVNFMFLHIHSFIHSHNECLLIAYFGLDAENIAVHKVDKIPVFAGKTDIKQMLI